MQEETHKLLYLTDEVLVTCHVPGCALNRANSTCLECTQHLISSPQEPLQFLLHMHKYPVGCLTLYMVVGCRTSEEAQIIKFQSNNPIQGSDYTNILVLDRVMFTKEAYH